MSNNDLLVVSEEIRAWKIGIRNGDFVRGARVGKISLEKNSYLLSRAEVAKLFHRMGVWEFLMVNSEW